MPEMVWEADGSRERINLVAELDRLLNAAEAEAHRTQPLIATLSLPDGRSLAIGLGRYQAVLSSTA